MGVADRMAKLRRMAEHPTSNPHEAAIARAELERLQRAHPQSTRWPSFDDRLSAAIAEQQRRQAAGVLIPGELGYYQWARTLKVGDRLRVKADGDIESWRTGPLITIERMTATQYIASDGHRYRRAGQFPGYRVGEDGRNGRRYIVKNGRGA